MKNYILLIISAFGLLLACKNHEQKTTEAKQEKKNFFPVADYLNSEIGYVDSLPLKMVKYVTVNKKTDSMLIKLAEFDSLAREFIPVELKDSSFQENFDESSFFDQTTNSLTFTYSTKNDKLELRRVDVLANHTTGFDKVRSVYLEKDMVQNNISVLKKMYWRSKKSFEIITIFQPLNQPQVTNHLKVVWDDGE
jgi:hypothetical protein